MSEELSPEIADLIINEGYEDTDVVPLSVILTGSRSYDCGTSKSDYDFLGIHITDTWNCLEHPRYQKTDQVINAGFDTSFNRVGPNTPTRYSLTSFELWKFLDIYEKGAFAAYELLFLPTTHHNPSVEPLEVLLRQGLSSKISYAAEHCDFKDSDISERNAKRSVYAIYRILQSLYFMQEQEFEWNAASLWKYGENMLRPETQELFSCYLNRENGDIQLTSQMMEVITDNRTHLIEEIRKMRVLTRLPEVCPKDTLTKILKCMRSMRGSLI